MQRYAAEAVAAAAAEGLALIAALGSKTGRLPRSCRAGASRLQRRAPEPRALCRNAASCAACRYRFKGVSHDPKRKGKTQLSVAWPLCGLTPCDAMLMAGKMYAAELWEEEQHSTSPGGVSAMACHAMLCYVMR